MICDRPKMIINKDEVYASEIADLLLEHGLIMDADRSSLMRFILSR